MDKAINEIEFPTAHPLVMDAERTFWEKATAAHVYCQQARLRGERYSRPMKLDDNIKDLERALNKLRKKLKKCEAAQWF